MNLFPVITNLLHPLNSASANGNKFESCSNLHDLTILSLHKEIRRVELTLKRMNVVMYGSGFYHLDLLFSQLA